MFSRSSLKCATVRWCNLNVPAVLKVILQSAALQHWPTLQYWLHDMWYDDTCSVITVWLYDCMMTPGEKYPVCGEVRWGYLARPRPCSGRIVGGRTEGWVMQHCWALSGSSTLAAVLFKGCLIMLCSGSRFLSPSFHHSAGGREGGREGEREGSTVKEQGVQHYTECNN